MPRRAPFLGRPELIYPVSGPDIRNVLLDSEIISLSGPDIRPDMISGAPLVGCLVGWLSG